MLEKSSDLSNRIIVILFIITILVSFMGTFLVLRGVNEVASAEQPEMGASSGTVSLTVHRPAVSSGGVNLEVLSRQAASS